MPYSGASPWARGSASHTRWMTRNAFTWVITLCFTFSIEVSTAPALRGNATVIPQRSERSDDFADFDPYDQFETAMNRYRLARTRQEFERQIRRAIRCAEFELFRWEKLTGSPGDHHREVLKLIERSAQKQWGIRRRLGWWWQRRRGRRVEFVTRENRAHSPRYPRRRRRRAKASSEAAPSGSAAQSAAP